jgi:hypothetical protein
MEQFQSKEGIAASLRTASEDIFTAALSLDVYVIDGAEAVGEHQALENAVQATESWRVGPAPAITPGSRPQSYKHLELSPELLAAVCLREENLEHLAVALNRIDSSPQTASVSHAAEAIIREIEPTGRLRRNRIRVAQGIREAASDSCGWWKPLERGPLRWPADHSRPNARRSPLLRQVEGLRNANS